MAGLPARLAVLISGRGRNLEAIQRAIDRSQLRATITGVFCNRARAPGLAFARAAGLATTVLRPRDYAGRAAYDTALADAVAASAPDWVALAGFMRVLSPAFVACFRGRLVNIHPSLLPAYKGVDTHARALRDDAARHGASVHFVTETLDAGPVIRQGWIRVRAGDDAAALGERVSALVEQRLYPATLAELAAGRVVCQASGVCRDGQPQLKAPNDDYDPA